MSDDVTIFEAGLRLDCGNYSTFIQSRDVNEVDDYIDIMKKTKPENFKTEMFSILKKYLVNQYPSSYTLDIIPDYIVDGDGPSEKVGGE